jgi:hypothetical protein
MEGGGDSTDSKAAIRRGMGEFLREIRDRARSRKRHWKVVACGGRNAARAAFEHAVKEKPHTLNVLLVDSEEAVTGTPRVHLNTRPGWNLLGADDAFHLMAQTMETWIVADADTLKRYYGQGFLEGALLGSIDLESVAKADIARMLEHATRGTQKLAYHKIHHASELLARIDPAKVQQRCRHCRRLFDVLTSRLETA